MSEFLDSLPRNKYSQSSIDTNKIVHPVGPPMSVDMLMERGTDLAGAFNQESPVSADTIERAVYFLGEITIAGRTAERHKDRRWLSAASSFWTAVLCLETDLSFSTPVIEGEFGHDTV